MRTLEPRTSYHQRVLRFVGVIILVVGLGSAACIYWNASDADDATDSLTKRDLYQLEKLGGKELVLSTQLQEWFSSLWHGRRLALTVAGASHRRVRAKFSRSAKATGRGEIIAWSGGRF